MVSHSTGNIFIFVIPVHPSSRPASVHLLIFPSPSIPILRSASFHLNTLKGVKHARGVQLVQSVLDGQWKVRTYTAFMFAIPLYPSSRPASSNLNTFVTVQRAPGVRSRRHAVHGGQHLQRQRHQGGRLYRGGIEEYPISAFSPLMVGTEK